MKKENQSRSDERIRKLKEQYVALQVETAQQRKEDIKEIDELKKENLRKKAERDKEIDELRKENAQRDKEISELKKENLKKKAEQDKEISELKKENAERDKKISQLEEKYLKEKAERDKEDAERDKEDAERKKESDERLKRIEKQIEENGKLINENGKLINENGKQIGGLGNKFGDYTEAMARPSIKRILEERFDADYKGSVRITNSEDVVVLEVDAWGRSRNSTGAAYIVETKSKFRDKHFKQIWQLVERFRYYRLDNREERAVYPMLAAVQISEEQRRRVWAAGIYLIDINEGVFRYAKPPKGFEAKGYHGVHRVQRSVPQLRLAVGGVEKPRRAE